MSSARERFRSEAALVRRGRRLVRAALRDVEGQVGARYEVQVPGVVPDLVIYLKEGGAVQYVITIEFKLGDWRRAVNQAFRHRNFGNEAYVVLDQARADSAMQHLEVFEHANVGLVTIDTKDVVRIRHLPEPGLPFSSQFSRVAARALLPSRRSFPSDLPFIRSIRGGVALAGLRTVWCSTNQLSESG